jgi:L-ascorbate metabolism protein UlaG (beta-lactamase superfamily)
MQSISLTGSNLFDIANRWLGDATLWYVIAGANGISDPWLNGLTTLIIPDTANATGASLVAD